MKKKPEPFMRRQFAYQAMLERRIYRLIELSKNPELNEAGVRLINHCIAATEDDLNRSYEVLL